MLNKALLAAYRCPEEFCSYTLAGELSFNSGIFDLAATFFTASVSALLPRTQLRHTRD
jgi:hypothetical protein